MSTAPSVGVTNSARDLFSRGEKGSLGITSDLPFSKCERIFKDPMTTAAAFDRLDHYSVILQPNLSSYRVQAAKQQTIKKTTKE